MKRERERERKRGEAQIGNGLDFWEMAPKAVRKSPEPPNFHSSRPVVKLSEGPFFASSFSSHRRPISLCTIYLSLICFLRFLRKHYKHDPGPAPLRVNMRNSRALKSTLAALKWCTHTHTHRVLHTSWNISPASTWRPLGALEFISNTDKYVLNHGGERFNLQLECKAPDNPLAALYCCYGGHSTPIQCRAKTLYSVHLCEFGVKYWNKS